ncbi:MAG: hypothetical protein HY355_02475, partial [Armatimonadetes bacterium]|nr:hypothetical protein [Armatimonadota bacterium]
MGRIILLIAAVALAASACQSPSFRRRAEPGAAPTPSLPAQNVVIEVFGTPGLRFEGSMGELGATKTV